MSLKKFLAKYEVLAKELVRCGSCSNILLHSGNKYEIVSLLDGKEEGLLCESCKRNNRNIELVTRVSSSAEDNNSNNIFQVPISQLNNTNNINDLEKEQD
jgi:hypothetical protein